MTPKQILKQMNVHEDPAVNKQLTEKERLSNIESDIIHQRDAIDALVEQNDKYAEYLDVEIKSRKISTEFWQDVKKKLAISGIWGTVIIIFSAIVYAAKQWILNH